jgi:hypothetical protein
MGEYDCWRDDAFVQEPLWSVQVGEQRFEETGPLEQRSFERRPLPSVDEDRYRVEEPGPARVVGVVVGDVVGPFGDDEAVGPEAQPVEVVAGVVAEQPGERLPAGAQSARLVEEVVVATALDDVGGRCDGRGHSASLLAARKYASAMCSWMRPIASCR